LHQLNYNILRNAVDAIVCVCGIFFLAHCYSVSGRLAEKREGVRRVATETKREAR